MRDYTALLALTGRWLLSKSIVVLTVSKPLLLRLVPLVCCSALLYAAVTDVGGDVGANALLSKLIMGNFAIALGLAFNAGAVLTRIRNLEGRAKQIEKIDEQRSNDAMQLATALEAVRRMTRDVEVIESEIREMRNMLMENLVRGKGAQ